MRIKSLVLVKKIRISKEQSQSCCPAEHKNKVPRLAISKIMTEHQNRAWLYIVCMKASSSLTL